MDILRLFEFWDFFRNSLGWLIPATLAILLLIQLLYYTYLNINVKPRRRRPRQNPPESPIMPTDPESNANINYRPRQQQSAAPNRNLSLDGVEEPPHFVVLKGLPNISEIELPASEFGIGRFYAPEKNILVSLDERSVSRRHAVFIGDTANQSFALMDTSSSYGTSLRRGERFEPLTPGQEIAVYNGDVVQFGSVVTVRLVLPGDTRAHAMQA